MKSGTSVRLLVHPKRLEQCPGCGKRPVTTCRISEQSWNKTSPANTSLPTWALSAWSMRFCPRLSQRWQRLVPRPVGSADVTKIPLLVCQRTRGTPVGGVGPKSRDASSGRSHGKPSSKGQRLHLATDLVRIRKMIK